jgi:hypothetical protein
MVWRDSHGFGQSDSCHALALEMFGMGQNAKWHSAYVNVRKEPRTFQSRLVKAIFEEYA